MLETVNISVVIPTYNREKTIEKCLESVTHQTYKPHEIILVDDGSKDDTIKIAESIKCSNLKIIKQNRKGAQRARNTGIMNASGNYIAFIDSDDEWLPTLLEEEVMQLKKLKKDVVLYSDCYIYNEKKKRKKIWRLPGKSGNIYRFLLLHQGPMFQSMLVKRESLLKIGLLDEKVAAYQEWETAIRLAKNYNFIHLEKPLFVYTIHDGETISKDKKRGFLGYKYIIKKHRKEILKETGLQGLLFHYKRLISLWIESVR